MKKRSIFSMLLLMTMCFLVITACSNKDKNELNASQDNQLDESQNNINDSDENEKENNEIETDGNKPGDSVPNDADKQNEDHDMNVEDDDMPSDQGDLNVWYEGDIDINDKMVTVHGRTNLLPDTSMLLMIDSEEGVLIGTSDRDRVSKDGHFELSSQIPDSYDGIIHVEVVFKPEDQDEDIKNHYANQLDGDFVRLYSDSIESYQKASFLTTLSTEDSQVVSIEAPKWDIPNDYGKTKIWIEPDIEKTNEYIIVHLNSNLLDDTRINVRADIPDYIAFGFSGYTNVNPDGSATIYVNNPLNDKRIKNVTEYDLVIKVDPHDGNNGPHIIDVYGENGENLEGDLVKQDGDVHIIEMRLNVKAE